MRSEAETIEALARESGVSVATVRKLFKHGTTACAARTVRAVCDAAERLHIALELVHEGD